ncbi:MAG: hypothetical protein FVQ81_14990 [Candidatus Glassbacteria bacterium]|nr:hypothetical protein [Candidatus Glassbacteria bacterium]
MAKYFILMGDVIASSDADNDKLRRHFKSLVSACNSSVRNHILSPYTITLGDEFQGIASSLRAIVESIFFFEEESIKKKYSFKIRYVAHYGEIQTPINEEIAYEMLGPGLTKARKLLTQKRRNRPRFLIDLPDQKLSNNINRLFQVVGNLMDRWNIKDFSIIDDMILNSNNEQVAAKHGKNRTQIWKRRNNLLIEEYKLIKDVLFDLIEES